MTDAMNLHNFPSRDEPVETGAGNAAFAVRIEAVQFKNIGNRPRQTGFFSNKKSHHSPQKCIKEKVIL